MVDVAVATKFMTMTMAVIRGTSRRHAALSWARRYAVARPRFSGRRSVSTVLSHDCLGRPGFRLQSAGVSAKQACRARLSIRKGKFSASASSAVKIVYSG